MTSGVHPRIEAALNLAAVWLDAHRDFTGLPGVSAGVVLGEELVWSGAFGLANVEAGTPASADTIYSICSISKLFTAIACMQLRDQGKLSLSDPVAQHLDWFALEESVPDQRPITIEMLLTHSAGLPREAADAPYWSPPDFKFPSRDEIVAQLSGQTTLYESSTFWQYSNLGLSLVGEIVAAVSGESYEAYVTEHVLAPLGLTETRPYFPTSKHGAQMAIGYGGAARDGQRPTLPPFDTEGVCAAAGFTSTVVDLAKFAAWQHRTLNGTDTTGVLARSTLKEMHRAHWIDPYVAAAAYLNHRLTDCIAATPRSRPTSKARG
jgi:CubicO group peptidase (beta-lactamase class C family)